VPILDGLRGSMLILILLVHFRSVREPTPGDWAEQSWHFVLDMAVFTLDVFFVLSGFLITRILIDAHGSDRYFSTFYGRRALRIFPVYYGFLIVYFLVLPNVAAWADALALSPAQHAVYWTHLTNVAAGLNDWWNPAAAGPDWYPLEVTTGHLWSLSLEEQFYLVWPAVVYFSSLDGLKKASIACIVAAPIVRIALVATMGGESSAAYLLTPARMDGLAIGSLFAVCAQRPDGLQPFLRRAGLAATLSLLALAALFFWEGHINLDTSGWFHAIGLTASVYLAAAIVVISLFARPGELWYRVFGNAPLRRIGDYSYATYVMHYPIMFVLDATGVWSRPPANSGLRAEFLYSGPMLAICIAAGALSWHLYEERILKLRRYLPYGGRQGR
jgi:peptidoglycan/LPS O-acetylase OafA/YrhL